MARTVAVQSIEMELWQSNRSDRYKTVVKSGKFEQFIKRSWQELKRNFCARKICAC